MTLPLIKKGDIYHAVIHTAEGRKTTVTTKATSRADAQKAIKESGLDKVQSAARTHRLTSEGITRILAGKRVTMERAVAEWVTWMRNVGQSERHIENASTTVMKWIAECGLEKAAPATITEKSINAWINNADSDSKYSWRRAQLSYLRSFFDFLAARGWSIGNPAQLVRVNMNILSHDQKETIVREVFTRDEITKLLSEAEGFWKFAILIAYETGLRLGDICQLEWSCFEEEGEVRVWTDKRNTRVALKISKRLQNLLAEEVPVVSQQYLFPEQRAIHLDNARRAYLSKQFTRLCERIGIEGKSFHCLRHTLVERLREEGKEWKDIARELGHRHEETTKGYATKKVGGKK